MRANAREMKRPFSSLFAAQNLRKVSAAPLLSPPAAKSADKSRRLWGYIFAALGTVLFSMKAIFIKLAYMPGAGLAAGDLEPITLMVLRMGFALPIYIIIGVIIARRKRARGEALPRFKMVASVMAIGCLGYYICAFLDFTGLQYITAQLERLLLFTYPGFVVILGALFFGAKLRVSALACIALAYSGLIVIFAGGDIASGSNVMLGSILLLSCAILFALFQLCAKSFISQIGAPLFTCLSMIAATIGVCVHFIVSNDGAASMQQALTLPARIYILGAGIALFSTILASFAVNLALGRIGAQATATIGMLSPIAVVVVAVTILSEPFGWVDALGTGLTILGIGLYTYLDRKGDKARPANSGQR